MDCDDLEDVLASWKRWPPLFTRGLVGVGGAPAPRERPVTMEQFFGAVGGKVIKKEPARG